MSPYKLAEVAESTKLHKLAAKLSKKEEERDQKKQFRFAKRKREAAEWDAKQAKINASTAAYEKRRRAECEQDPTDPRTSRG